MKYLQFYTLLCFVLFVSSQNLEFTQQPEAVYYTHTSVSLVIQCNSTGSKVTYRRDNAAVRTTVTNEAYTRSTPVEGTDGSEAGIQWDCQASNDDGVIVSSRAIVYWAKFEDTGSSAQESITIRNSVISYLPCNFFNGSLPPPVIAWEKNDVEIIDPKILPGSNSLLLEASDAANNDKYRCILLNRYGNPNDRVPAITEYVLTVVTVETTPTLPSLAFPSNDFTRTVGDTIHFECVAYRFNCFWQVNTGGDSWVKILGSPLYTGNLFSVTVTADTLTMYRANVAGTYEDTRTLTIYQRPEVVSSIVADFIEYEQQNISINCQRSGVPDPTVDLYKDSVLIQNQANKYTLSTAGNTTTLEIQDIDSTDTGYYTCRADNPEASAAASGLITVRVAVPPTFTQHPTPVSITSVTGSDFNISCTAEGDPLPKIAWRFTRSGVSTTLMNSTEYIIVDSTDQTIESRTSMITVSPISAKHNGNYQCIGENFKAKVASSASVVLIPSAPVIDSVFSFTTVEIFEGEMYFQDCVAYAEPPPVVTWSVSAFGRITTNSSDHVIYANNTLVVTGNRQLSGNVYTCTATSGGNTESNSFTLLIHSCAVVEVTPAGPLNSAEHVNATLKCVVNGLPLPSYKWVYKPIGSSELGSLPSTGVSAIGQDMVRIEPISAANEGSYCCMAYTDELNDTCGVELVCVAVEYKKDCQDLLFCLFELWQFIVIVIAAVILILLIIAALFCVVYLIFRHYQSHTYNINRAVGLSMPYTKDRRDDDSDDDGEFDPTYESLPANKSTHPPGYKQAPYYNGGGDDSGLPSYNPPPQAGGDTTSLPLDGVLGPPAFSYPPPIDMHHASMPMLPGNFSQVPEMYAHDFMQPEMYPGDMMKQPLDEFLSTDGQFV